MSDSQDTTNDNGSEDLVAAMPTTAELLAADLSKDGATFAGKDSADSSAAAMLAVVDRIGSKFGDPFRVASATLTGIVGDIARAIIVSLRYGITTNENRPDLSGSTDAYKASVRMVVSDIVGDQATDSERTSFRNRLQKRIVRELPAAVLETVCKRNGITLTPKERKRILSLNHETAAAEKNETALRVIALVNEEFRVGIHSDNEPFSPFEAPKGKNGSGGGPGTADADTTATAVEHKRTVESFATAAAAPTVSVGDAVASVVSALRVIAHKLSGDVHYGTGGKGAVSSDLYRASTIAYCLGAQVSGQTLSPSQLADLAAALETVPEAVPASETAAETVPDATAPETVPAAETAPETVPVPRKRGPRKVKVAA